MLTKKQKAARRHQQRAAARRSFDRARRDSAMQRTFSVLKSVEGGLGSKEAVAMLSDAGICSLRVGSPYIGHDGVKVYGTKAMLRKAERILFGPLK